MNLIQGRKEYEEKENTENINYALLKKQQKNNSNNIDILINSV